MACLLELQALRVRVAELEEKAGKNSRNSSKPPSSDPPGTPPIQKPPTGRRRGGQRGHRGHGRVLLPVEKVDKVIELQPTTCEGCGSLLLGEDSEPQRRQVTEIPRVVAEVAEYRQHALRCISCGKENRATWPAEAEAGSFGPRLSATVGYLTGRMGVSQRDVEEIMGTVFHAELSLGSIPERQEAVSSALEKPVVEVQAYVREQAVGNADETGWQEGNTSGWLWILTTPLATMFLIMAHRGAAEAKFLLGRIIGGQIVGTDRCPSYNWIDIKNRQLCWAHLKRDFQALVDRKGEAARIGAGLLDEVHLVFGLWHQFREKQIVRSELKQRMEPVKDRIRRLLEDGQAIPCKKTQRFCRNILKFWSALWTFVETPGVEPTNNSAERRLRRAVIWRRRSFGTQSERGSRFVERVLTTVTTLRQQNRDVLDYLTDACMAAIHGRTPPSLMPSSPQDSSPSPPT